MSSPAAASIFAFDWAARFETSPAELPQLASARAGQRRQAFNDRIGHGTFFYGHTIPAPW
jgi:hypothetical protein